MLECWSVGVLECWSVGVLDLFALAAIEAPGKARIALRELGGVGYKVGFFAPKWAMELSPGF